MALYFLQSPDGGAVKIGYSEDVEARHRQLEAHYGRPLTLLTAIPIPPGVVPQDTVR
jgi:hypothetical protein